MQGENNPSYKHGLAKRGARSNIYRRWQHMVQRCHNPNDADYPEYGARGITVCEEWRNDFLTFLEDMGVPAKNMSLERNDNHGHYNKANCRWASPREQANNRRSTKMLTIQGKTLALSYWCELAGIGQKTVLYRLKQGMEHEAAVFTAPSNGNKFNLTSKVRNHEQS